MKQILISTILSFVCCSVALAQSNVSGVWLNQGQTLTINIVDNPAEPPFVAGAIWQAMQGSSQNRTVKTENFELKCAGANQVGAAPFGNCKIKVARQMTNDQGSELNFGISKDEARAALQGFVPRSEHLVIRSGVTDEYGQDSFIFEANWQWEMIALVINKKIVSE